MTTVLLVRHGLTDANTGGCSPAGPRASTSHEGGREAGAGARRAAGQVPLAAIVSSPLERCQETAAALLAERDGSSVETDDRLGECRYGDWTGAS